jgi:hypothetical protein
MPDANKADDFMGKLHFFGVTNITLAVVLLEIPAVSLLAGAPEDSTSLEIQEPRFRYRSSIVPVNRP